MVMFSKLTMSLGQQRRSLHLSETMRCHHVAYTWRFPQEAVGPIMRHISAAPLHDFHFQIPVVRRTHDH